MSDTESDLARGMYGGEAPVRPAPGGQLSAHCLRGHDLAIAHVRNSYHHRYHLTQLTCSVCYAMHDPMASWCLVNPADLHTTQDAPTQGLTLVRIPPAARGGIGQLQLRIDGTVLADLDLAVCGPCRRAVLEQVRSDVPRRGYGRVLVAAALTIAPPVRYRWTTTSISDDPVTRAFWARIGWPGDLGQPDYCTDLDRAAGRLPDW